MKGFFIAAVMLISVYPLAAQEGKAAMFRGNEAHTGVYESGYTGSPKEFAWIFSTGGAVRSTPLYYDGKIFAGSADHNLYAVNSSTGELVWSYPTNGPVNSSPAADQEGNIYFLSGDNNLYCVNSLRGELKWKFTTGKDLPYRWGFDYLLSSAVIHGNKLYFGSGDGNLYALSKTDGTLIWKYYTGSRIRTSPAIYGKLLLFGDMGGSFYALNISDGSLSWKFSTDGGSTGNNMGEEGFDRTAIISSPAADDSIVCFGARDGFLYALNVFTGRQIWKFDHQVSWVISTPAIYNKTVFTGSSDGHFVQAVDLLTGKEKWRFNTPGLVWSSPTISGDYLYFGDGKGNLFQIESGSGKVSWKFKFSKWLLSSVIVYDDLLCFGCDDGNVYSLRGNKKPANELIKAVYWEDTGGYKWFKNRIDESVKDYFMAENYELLNAVQLKDFMEKRADDKKPSVIIFASNKVPYSIVPDTSDQNLFLTYLKSGGKSIFIGNNPLGYIRDASTDKLVSVDYTVASKILDIKFKGVVTDALRGVYTSIPTNKGRKLGITKWWTGFGGVERDEVTTVLATNEAGEASAWLKNYGGPEGTGLIQLWIDNSIPEDITFIQQAAEFTN